MMEIDFSKALLLLRFGNRIARSGWKGMYLYYVGANAYAAVTRVAREEFGPMVPYGAYIALKTADNNVVPWTASQTDLLAEDWVSLD